MDTPRRVVRRVLGVLVRLGVVSHPYGREYAREHYTLTGRRVTGAEPARRPGRVSPRAGATLVAVALLLLSLAAAGVLFVAS
jgi:hypothetical protein